MYTFKTKTGSILLVFICNLSVTTTVALATFIEYRNNHCRWKADIF